MKVLKFLIDLPFRFIAALIGFTFFGWIGWVGLILIGLKFFHVIPWPWWVVALPLAYGVLYCLYMTIDGALYRAGLKGVGGYARYTSRDEQIAQAEIDRAVRNLPKKEPFFEILERVHSKLPQQLLSQNITRAIAEQINYATGNSKYYEGDDGEMQRKLRVLSDELLRNGATEAVDEIVRAVNMRPHYLASADDITR